MILAFLFFSLLAVARAEPADTQRLSTIEVIGSEAQELNQPNSSAFLSKEKLEKHADTDVTRAVKSVPGVYVREEEGFGLRPNIGLRGTNPDRSKKINFLEDGVLIGPAPYSAPAAYYTPSLLHTENLEVFKGVATVPYGPNSVGGTINFITPEYGENLNGFIDGTGGSFGYGKLVGRIAKASERVSVLLQGGFHRTDGFKELEGGGGTGFEQFDILAKTRVRLSGGDRPQIVDLKVGYTNEDSRETYLGLTDSDFEESAYLRYRASALDRMQWNHQTYQGSYTLGLSSNSTLTATAYWHLFDRVWYRLDRLNSTVSLREVLNNPETYPDQYRILRGLEDSNVLPGGQGQLDVVRNARGFNSRGVELQHLLSAGIHELRWGLRVHQDEIQRNHGLDRYAMTSGRLERTADDRITSEKDKDQSWAQALFAHEQLNFGALKIVLAARWERVQTRAQNFYVNNVPQSGVVKNSDEFFVPGAGLLYSLTSNTSVFAGVNKGYSPVGPGQQDSVRPEESINSELGLRHLSWFFAEAIGFSNDYQNIKGLCSFSSGCTSNEGEEFNGGKARIYGLEARAQVEPAYAKYRFPLELSYTFTSAKFASDFTSGSQEWGQGAIRSGSPLPYVPEHQYQLSLGLQRGQWSADLRFNWVGKQYDQASEQGRKAVAAYGVVDASVKYKLDANQVAYLKADNLLDNEYVVSYRPYGARPGKAQMLQLGFRQTF